MGYNAQRHMSWWSNVDKNVKWKAVMNMPVKQAHLWRRSSRLMALAGAKLMSAVVDFMHCVRLCVCVCVCVCQLRFDDWLQSL